MITSSNGNNFRVTGPLCGKFTGKFPSQRPMTLSFDVFDLHLNKRLSKLSRRWWFKTASRSLWRHCYDSKLLDICIKDNLMSVHDQAINNVCLTLGPGGRFKNTYELLNLRALKFSYVNKIHIFQCMGKIFCVEFQRYPLKFHTKNLTHTLKDMTFIQHWKFKSS